MNRALAYRPSPAMLVALLALFIAMGGTGYAALNLPANSVGTAQLKDRAVTSAKVKPSSLLASNFKAGQLPAGAKGATGARGAQGLTGDTGATGVAGTQGPNGDTGATGADGAQGPKGDTGATGAHGANGLSAYESWLGLGNTGTVSDYEQSLIGPQGATGATGPQGATGATGPQGAAGATGPPGATGATGAQGPSAADYWFVTSSSGDGTIAHQHGGVQYAGVGGQGPFYYLYQFPTDVSGCAVTAFTEHGETTGWTGVLRNAGTPANPDIIGFQITPVTAAYPFDVVVYC